MTIHIGSGDEIFILLFRHFDRKLSIKFLKRCNLVLLVDKLFFGHPGAY